MSGIICDKYLVVEDKILKFKLEVADKKNTFLRGDVKGLTVLLNAKLQPSFHNFKVYTKTVLVTKEL